MYIKENEILEYNIFIDSVFIDKITVFPNKKAELNINVDNSEFELSIIPAKTSNKFKIHNLFKGLTTVFFSYFFFTLTWESGLPSSDFFRLRSKKTIKIKQKSKNAKINLEIIGKKVKKSNELFITQINICHFENLTIENQNSEAINNLKELKNQLHNLIGFYIFWFLPALVLFLILFFYGISIMNALFVVISSVFFVLVTILNLVYVLLSFKIYNKYKFFQNGI